MNAADNENRDPSMDKMKLDIDKEIGRISVYSNGRGIPVEVHKKEGCYVQEHMFGHLLTSSNYDDSQKKVAGRQHGCGAKHCNIFSTKFIVETADKKGEELTRVSFKPDFARFNMEYIDADLEALLKKRAYDLAGCVKGVNVYLNGQHIRIKSFKEYEEMYIPVPGEDEEKPMVIYDAPNP
ncbi:DNA topoisomerase 2 [Mortierella alpina]|nr:DNA topoisomerase 2 [Mortierella alpina]